jgi:hypothetical protein
LLNVAWAQIQANTGMQLELTGLHMTPNFERQDYERQVAGDQFGSDSMQPIYQSEDLNSTFANLAMSMSNAIRAADETVVLETRDITIYKIHWR